MCARCAGSLRLTARAQDARAHTFVIFFPRRSDARRCLAQVPAQDRASRPGHQAQAQEPPEHVHCAAVPSPACARPKGHCSARAPFHLRPSPSNLAPSLLTVCCLSFGFVPGPRSSSRSSASRPDPAAAHRVFVRPSRGQESAHFRPGCAFGRPAASCAARHARRSSAVQTDARLHVRVRASLRLVLPRLVHHL